MNNKELQAETEVHQSENAELLPSAPLAANPMLYAEIKRAARILWRKYVDKNGSKTEYYFDWQDLMHEVLIGLEFDCSKIALFSYRFKNALIKEQVKQYVYNKYIKKYAYYFDVSMPEQDFPDFPVGADIETCIKFLVKKLGRPLSCSEAVYHIRKEDYTRYLLKCNAAVKAALRNLEPRFAKMDLEKSKSMSGLKNINSKFTEEKQTEAKRLHEIWGKKYKAIGEEIGLSKETVRQFIMGNSYRAVAV